MEFDCNILVGKKFHHLCLELIAFGDIQRVPRTPIHLMLEVSLSLLSCPPFFHIHSVP